MKRNLIDAWDSDTTEILINPRIPEEQRLKVGEQLQKLELRSHFWLATSGSSASSNISPKWVALSKTAVLCSAKAVNDHLQATRNDRWVHALPYFHVGGLGILARAHLLGCQVVQYQAKWNPNAFQICCSEHSATLTALVPTQLYDLVQKQLIAPKSLRGAIIGGGALSAALYWAAKALNWNPLPSYGLSECASQVATAPLDSLQSKKFPFLKFLPHICAVAQTEDSCLKLRSAALLTTYGLITERETYLQDPKKDEWFATEDIVLLQGDSVKIEGRKTDVVKIGGENVNVGLLNSLLETLSIDAFIEGDRAIVAMPTERLGYEIHLVEAKTPPDKLKLLIAQFNSQVLPFERIRRIHHLKDIPRTPLHKIKKNILSLMIHSSH